MSKFKNGLKFVGMSLLVTGATVLVNPNKASAQFSVCNNFIGGWFCGKVVDEFVQDYKSNPNNIIRKPAEDFYQPYFNPPLPANSPFESQSGSSSSSSWGWNSQP